MLKSLQTMSLNALGVLLIGITLSACAGFSSAPPLAQKVTALQSTVAAYTVNGPASDGDTSLDMNNSQLWFPAIAGHFYGTPDIESKWQPAIDGHKFEVSALQLDAELAKHAQPFDARETSVLISPENTRIARVAPFLLAQFDGEPIGESNWLNPESKRDLLLVYFDRSSRVLGSLFYGKKEVRFDLEIPGPGLYWLERRKSWFGPDKYVNGSSPNDTVLAVRMP